MELKPIRCFADFCDDLMLAGFTPASDSGGVFSLSDWFGNEIQWHTEQPDTDPWEWRMRVLEERDDIAYGKFFWKKGGGCPSAEGTGQRLQRRRDRQQRQADL